MKSNQLTQSNRSTRRYGKGFSVILALILTGSLLGLQRLSSAQVTPERTLMSQNVENTQTTNMTPLNPREELLKALKRMRENIRKAREKARKIREEGLPGKQQISMELHADLDAVEDDINIILNPGLIPSLTPADAGTANRVDPTQDLLMYASHTNWYIDGAIVAAETLNSPFGDEVIGSNIKTILDILPFYHAEADNF